MDITILQENGIKTVEISGRLDTLTSPELDRAVKPLITLGAVIEFNCEKMGYISSSGLRVILSPINSLLLQEAVLLSETSILRSVPCLT